MTIGIALLLHDRDGSPRANVSGLSVTWWDTPDPAAFVPPAGLRRGLSTNASGYLVLDLSVCSALGIGEEGYVLVYKDGATPEDALAFTSRLETVDVGVLGEVVYPLPSGHIISGLKLVLDPSDDLTVFQDVEGTVLAGEGDPVGLILDKSGNGNHATQSTATSRPIREKDGAGRWYLYFDGTDDALFVPEVLGTLLDERGAWCASVAVERSAGGRAYPSLFGKWQTASPRRSVDLQIRAPSNLISVERVDDEFSQIIVSGGSFDVGERIVASGGYTGSDVYAQKNLDSPVSAAHEKSVGSGTHIAVQVPRSGFSGKIFGVVVCEGNPEQDEKNQIVRHLAARAGVSL